LVPGLVLLSASCMPMRGSQGQDDIHSLQGQPGDKDGASDSQPLCPSAQPEMEQSVVFGVVGGTVEVPRLAYLKEPQPVTDEVLSLSGPVKPTEVFRFAAPCAGSACQHFDGADCRLAKRTVRMLPEAVHRLPPCRLRPRCRWWQQEGGAACMRCPMVVTENYWPSEEQRRSADPSSQE
jgi:hypothetical protein